eukprot:COSAG02_NODE_6586_length_3476_cov_2.239266_4_plen_113_part_00
MSKAGDDDDDESLPDSTRDGILKYISFVADEIMKGAAGLEAIQKFDRLVDERCEMSCIFVSIAHWTGRRLTSAVMGCGGLCSSGRSGTMRLPGVWRVDSGTVSSSVKWRGKG